MAIPLRRPTSERATCLYDLIDSDYDAASIWTLSQRLDDVPIIDPKTPSKPKTQLPCRVKPIPVSDPPKVIRFRERTMVGKQVHRNIEKVEK